MKIKIFLHFVIQLLLTGRKIIASSTENIFSPGKLPIMTAVRLIITSLFLLCCSQLLLAQQSLQQPTPTSSRLTTQQSDPLSLRDNNLSSVAPQVEFLPVDQAYVLNTQWEQENQAMRINWQIASGYYLYRHSFKFSIVDNDNNEIGFDAAIPAGLAKEDEYFGKVEVYYHNIDILLDNIAKNDDLRLAITYQGCADAGLCYPPQTRYYQINASLGSAKSIAKPQAIANSSTGTGSNNANNTATDLSSLPLMLLLALVGGMILNLMPCVFPVLSLKVLAFANDKEHSQTTHGLAYTAGVVASFMAVAALLISLQSAGEAIGWGFQLQTPWFVATLAYLFFILGLSLSGVIEFGGQWMNFGNKFASQSGYTGSFFTGTLAAVVASPCTAPLMGTALGFAVTQPPVIALSIFASLGLGMALPVLILSFSPRLLAKIPKPGLWMEKLKQFLAFPLYATAVWLSWIVGNQTGVNGMALLLLGCVLIALALWFWTYHGKITKSLSIGLAIVALAILTSPLLETQQSENQEKNWVAYSPQKLAEIRKEGKPIFLNITADWCITCLANEKVALNTQSVQDALQANGITYIKGDWTNPDPNISALLNLHGRDSIPLYLIYHANSNKVEVLPQFLTTSILLEAFNRAI